jgi:hypothetical protein
MPVMATEALHRLVGAVERSRYGRPEAAGDEVSAETLRDDTRRVRAGLLASAEPRQRWAARLLPVSTLSWATSTAGGAMADALDRLDDALAAAGRRLHRRPQQG